MAYKHFTNAIEQEAEFSSANERYIYLEASYRADRKGIIRMSQSEMATITLLSPRTIASIFDVLEKRKLLVRVGHGRYQVPPPTSDPEVGMLIQQIRKWVKDNYDNEPGDNEICILEHNLETIPDFIKKAIELGLFVESGKSSVIITKDKSEALTYYTLHLP